MAAFVSTTVAKVSTATGALSALRLSTFTCPAAVTRLADLRQHAVGGAPNRRPGAAFFATTTTNTPAGAPKSSADASTTATRMSAAGRSGTDSSGSGLDTIDFGKVDLQEGNEMSGMIFKPDATDVDTPYGSRARYGYSDGCEAAINNQINVEFTASYAYTALFAYFDRDSVALPGFAKFFNEQVTEEREHATQFIQYQNKRGGKVHLKPVAVPAMQFSFQDGTSDALHAMELALQLEKHVYGKLLEVWSTADGDGDPELTNVVEDYLSHQVDSIKEIASYVSQLKRVGTGHGVYDIDRQLQG